jgi:hypothetical protein
MKPMTAKPRATALHIAMYSVLERPKEAGRKDQALDAFNCAQPTAVAHHSDQALYTLLRTVEYVVSAQSIPEALRTASRVWRDVAPLLTHLSSFLDEPTRHFCDVFDCVHPALTRSACARMRTESRLCRRQPLEIVPGYAMLCHALPYDNEISARLCSARVLRYLKTARKASEEQPRPPRPTCRTSKFYGRRRIYRNIRSYLIMLAIRSVSFRCYFLLLQELTRVEFLPFPTFWLSSHQLRSFLPVFSGGAAMLSEHTYIFARCSRARARPSLLPANFLQRHASFIVPLKHAYCPSLASANATLLKAMQVICSDISETKIPTASSKAMRPSDRASSRQSGAVVARLK